jgi:hypothetical protein
VNYTAAAACLALVFVFLLPCRAVTAMALLSV